MIILNDKLIKALNDVYDACNSMSLGKDEIQESVREVLNKTHRTLQQTGFEVFFEVLLQMSIAFEQGRFDDRNEMSCKYSERMVNGLEWHLKDELNYSEEDIDYAMLKYRLTPMI